MKMLILVLMTLFVLAFISIETLIGYKRGIIKEAIRLGCIAWAVFLAFMCTRHSLKIQTGVINETLLYAAGESNGQNLSDKEKDAAEYVNNFLLDLLDYDETDTATASIKERIVSNLEVVFTSFTAPVLAVVYTGIFACLFILFKFFTWVIYAVIDTILKQTGERKPVAKTLKIAGAAGGFVVGLISVGLICMPLMVVSGYAGDIYEKTDEDAVSDETYETLENSSLYQRSPAKYLLKYTGMEALSKSLYLGYSSVVTDETLDVDDIFEEISSVYVKVLELVKLGNGILNGDVEMSAVISEMNTLSDLTSLSFVTDEAKEGLNTIVVDTIDKYGEDLASVMTQDDVDDFVDAVYSVSDEESSEAVAVTFVNTLANMTLTPLGVEVVNVESVENYSELSDEYNKTVSALKELYTLTHGKTDVELVVANDSETLETIKEDLAYLETSPFIHETTAESIATLLSHIGGLEKIYS